MTYVIPPYKLSEINHKRSAILVILNLTQQVRVCRGGFSVPPYLLVSEGARITSVDYPYDLLF